MRRLLFLVAIIVLASCSKPQTFVGTWRGTERVANLGTVSTICNFTEADVTCVRSGDVTRTSFGGAYVVKDSTTAVAPTAGYDFRRISETQLMFNNSSYTVTLTRVSGTNAGSQTAST